MFLENDKKIIIQCATTSGEKQIGKYHLDGYAEVNGKTIGLDFHGCRHHPCPHNCGTPPANDVNDLEYEKLRTECLEEHLDVYIVEYECEFRKKKYKPVGNIYKYQFRDLVEEAELVEAVADGSFFGLINVDIRCPDEVIEKYKDLGMPFIFQNIDLTEDHLSPTMRALAEANNVKYPRRQLCITYHGDGVLLISRLLKFYLNFFF